MSHGPDPLEHGDPQRSDRLETALARLDEALAILDAEGIEGPAAHVSHGRELLVAEYGLLQTGGSSPA